MIACAPRAWLPVSVNSDGARWALKLGPSGQYQAVSATSPVFAHRRRRRPQRRERRRRWPETYTRDRCRCLRRCDRTILATLMIIAQTSMHLIVRTITLRITHPFRPPASTMSYLTTNPPPRSEEELFFTKAFMIYSPTYPHRHHLACFGANRNLRRKHRSLVRGTKIFDRLTVHPQLSQQLPCYHPKVQTPPGSNTRGSARTWYRNQQALCRSILPKPARVLAQIIC